MNESLVAAIHDWVKASPGVTLTPLEDDEEFIELTWQRPAGDFGYILLCPEYGDVGILQHGTFFSPEQREQRGMERIRCSSDIEKKLTYVKAVLDTSKPVKPWNYKPAVEIGRVSSLKFR